MLEFYDNMFCDCIDLGQIRTRPAKKNQNQLHSANTKNMCIKLIPIKINNENISLYLFRFYFR